MTINETFEQIESMQFSAMMNVVSGYAHFTKIVKDSTAYRILRTYLMNDENNERLVRQRFENLWEEGDDSTPYENGNDTAFFAYVLALHEYSGNAWSECGKLVITPRLWWSKKLINELMNQKLF